MKKGAVGRLDRRQFEAFAQERRRLYHGSLFSLSIKNAENGSTRPLFSCVVSKKVEKSAAGRNLIKRRAREAMGRLLSGKNGLIVVIRAKNAAAGSTFKDIETELAGLVRLSGLV